LKRQWFERHSHRDEVIQSETSRVEEELDKSLVQQKACSGIRGESKILMVRMSLAQVNAFGTGAFSANHLQKNTSG
jgi:hypothetical protein